jgi:P2-related tail formation protein
MWSSWVKERGTIQVMYITKLKDGPKRVKKTFSLILERVFEMVCWRGENGITSKMIFDVEVFFSSQNIDFPFYLKRLLELFFFLLFLMLRPLRNQGF